jgi:hypothetical protein
MARIHALHTFLLVCPECKQIGKVPLAGRKVMRGYCTGGIRNSHSKARMTPELFVKSRAKVEDGQLD